MFSGNRLHPYRLPDTAYGSVPDTFRIADLLSTGLRSFIRWVPNFYDQLIIAFARKGGSNIERERSKSPVWLPTFTSFTHTSVFQSTAPKCNSTCFPFQAEGISKLRW